MAIAIPPGTFLRANFYIKEPAYSLISPSVDFDLHCVSAHQRGIVNAAISNIENVIINSHGNHLREQFLSS